MSPFSRQIVGNINEPLTHQEACECIVKMAEVLIHSASSRDHRVLGAMYFLIGLTIASTDARESLPWLYESYYDIVRR